MKRLLGSVFAAAIIASVPAGAAPTANPGQSERAQGSAPLMQLAQDRGRRDDDRGRRGDDRDRRDNDRGRGAGPRFEHGPREFERRAFQRNWTAPRRFRMGVFRGPPGWAYRRWTFGESLPRAYWARNYWITDFWLYDLDRPPLGTEWVRSGPDALLVDTVSGEVLQAEYNVFY